MDEYWKLRWRRIEDQPQLTALTEKPPRQSPSQVVYATGVMLMDRKYRVKRLFRFFGDCCRKPLIFAACERRQKDEHVGRAAVVMVRVTIRCSIRFIRMTPPVPKRNQSGKPPAASGFRGLPHVLPVFR
jgi:hypothetical protein